MIIIKETIDLGDLSGRTGGDRMDGLTGPIDRGDKGNATRAEEVSGRGEGESKVPVNSIPFMGRNGDCVGVKLGLSEPDGGVGRGRGNRGDRTENGNGEGGGNSRSGEGGGFLHGRWLGGGW